MRQDGVSAMATPWPKTPPSPAHHAAFAQARPVPFWLDDLGELPAAEPPLRGTAQADLVIVGGGFTGLWAAVQALREQPGRSVLVLEAGRAGHGASGRNGGFMEASLTHGLANGIARFPQEMDVLERLAAENFAGLLGDVEALGIACDVERSGMLTLLFEAYQEAALDEELALLERYGYAAQALRGAEAVGEQVRTPLARAALWQRGGAGLLHPGKLGAGLRRAALDLGARLHESTPVRSIERTSNEDVEVRTDAGRVVAHRAILATNAHRPLVRAVRRRIVPVYDYVLVSEPLSSEQLAAVGWSGRQGLSDAANQFHYFRLTPDDRILFGGYDAVYRYGSPVDPALEDHAPSFARLAQHLETVFPQLEGLQYSHRWGGAIDTCSRFSVFFHRSHGGRVASAVGYTGLGVVASRWGARVALDLVDGRTTEATELRFVRSRPVPFPPEPLRAAAIGLTRNRLAAADEREGRRGAWLGLLDRLGLGFDS